MSLLGRAITEQQAEKRAERDIRTFKPTPYRQELIDKMREWKPGDNLPFRPRRMGNSTVNEFYQRFAMQQNDRSKTMYPIVKFDRKGHGDIVIFDEYGSWPVHKWWLHPIKWLKQYRLERTIRKSLNIQKRKK